MIKINYYTDDISLGEQHSLMTGYFPIFLVQRGKVEEKECKIKIKFQTINN